MMIFDREPPQPPDRLRAAIARAYRADEAACVDALIGRAELPPDARTRVAERARGLVTAVREQRTRQGGIDAFMQEYELSTQEGVVLMCLAEALLRIPDDDTRDRLIRDKLSAADWERHVGQSESLFVNASTWALMLTGRVVRLNEYRGQSVGALLGRLVSHLGEPVIREAVSQAMRIMGRQFVMGRTIEKALARAVEWEKRGYRYSYDMLGEGARTMRDAERYYAAYERAIAAIGEAAGGRGPVESPGISVKLSALHPRYEFAKRERVMRELLPRLVELAARARGHGIGFTVDAEEAERLEPSLDVFEAASGDPRLAGWDGLGLAVQAYQKRAIHVLDWLADLARRHGRRLMVRLVKGAYWDTEIKRSQEGGYGGYPVFTRKAATDVSYIACVHRLFAEPRAFYPQFATHNAHTVSLVLEAMGSNREFEFQRLHGMGEALYGEIVGPDRLNLACRVYAPVGSHEDLLPYLVRRLLENGANSSFVNRIADERLPVEELIGDPVERMRRAAPKPHPKIPLPRDLYGAERPNSRGVDLTDPTALGPLAERMTRAAEHGWHAGPIVGGEEVAGNARQAFDPSDHRRSIGRVLEATPDDVDRALALAVRAAHGWDRRPAAERAACLERTADLLEGRMAEAMAIAVREGGKTLPDAVAEVREAVDFCRYYAARGREQFGAPLRLPGPTGEDDRLSLHGRGVFACISPWNFPLAIFTGQVAAALMAGNAVVAKPAEQTPLMAAFAVRLFHEAGVPGDVLHFLPGDGATVGGALVGDRRTAGVAFTGSTETAHRIARALLDRGGPIAPLIAETGGQNAMIIDSSALPEQVTDDVVASAFQSAGQRCSALRVLFVQEDVATKVVDMIAGAMTERRVGDPALLSTDIGPVIDRDAKEMLEQHAARMRREARLIYEVALDGAATGSGTFFAPVAFEIDGLNRLEREVFGPILHVIRYRASDLDRVLDAIDATGYGLTLGIHSRIDERVRYIHGRLRVGNTYVNRNQIGAVVGVHPFGGEG
ncbi:MAG TPA: bifunctional proline dehydrogenase/L-glutamate gamma-semialdehyde dehydrogenase PutA, partial [Geminicoccaceae bacterium]|nr:bifunctional proline dehydrogenase/L-glutamate gamma-semialdehyde dehydrogenase PutA [Geminicoccaceae bacterium]